MAREFEEERERGIVRPNPLGRRHPEPLPDQGEVDTALARFGRAPVSTPRLGLHGRPW
jgi:hypothetical protein